MSKNPNFKSNDDNDNNDDNNNNDDDNDDNNNDDEDNNDNDNENNKDDEDNENDEDNKDNDDNNNDNNNINNKILRRSYRVEKHIKHVTRIHVGGRMELDIQNRAEISRSEKRSFHDVHGCLSLNPF